VTKRARHNQRSMKRLLEANGWIETAGGKHVVKMTKPGHRPITLPHDKGGGGYPIGLIDGDHAAGRTQRRRRVMAGEVYTVRVHHEPGEELWAEVLELPGCFAAGADMDELRQALTEAISLYLSEPGDVKHVELEDEPGSVTEHRMLARTA
jgi:predicted RNase H-like HicB family nuclease